MECGCKVTFVTKLWVLQGLDMEKNTCGPTET